MFAPGKLIQGTVGEVLGPDPAEGVEGSFALRRPDPKRPALVDGREHEIDAPGRERAVQALDLGHVPDQARFDRRGRPPEDVRPAGVRCQQAEQDPDQRRLAPTVGPHHRHEVPRFGLEGEALQHGVIAEANTEVGGGDDGRGYRHERIEQFRKPNGSSVDNAQRAAQRADPPLPCPFPEFTRPPGASHAGSGRW